MKIDKIVALSQKITKNGSPTTTVYLLKPGDSPLSSGVGRVGGDPVGVSDLNWPLFRGKPMDHLLTLDLEGMPALRTGPLADARAVSLFIGDRNVNEAFLPGTEETAIVVLSEADVSRGPSTPLRPAGAPARSLEITAVEVPLEVFRTQMEPDDPELAELWGELFNASAYAGGGPIWLQQAEHEGQFLLQFDESFIDMNLGDAGVMYAFADTAFWQCH